MNISLTFDDGWRCQYEKALPILNEYGFKATFYIITCYLRQKHPLYMDRGEILQLSEQGHEIGAHTVTHPDLRLTFLWNIGEVGQSKNDLADIGIAAKTFAYPYGRHNMIVRNKVRMLGYDNARGTVGKFHSKGMDKYRIRARSIRAHTTPDDVKRWIDEAKDQLLVLIFHQVEECPPAWGCEPRFFAEICRLLSGCESGDLRLTSVLNKFMDRV